MDKPTVKKILEELVIKFEPDRKYLEKSTMGKLLIDQALAQLDALYKEWYLGMLPKKSQTQATKTGAWYESEFDEGFNKCRDIMQDNMERKNE